MIEESENRKCAHKINNLLYEMVEKGHSNNAICNGLIFALSIHILNSKFDIKEIIMQLKKLFFEIKTELGRLEDTDDPAMKEPINPQWD